MHHHIPVGSMPIAPSLGNTDTSAAPSHGVTGHWQLSTPVLRGGRRRLSLLTPLSPTKVPAKQIIPTGPSAAVISAGGGAEAVRDSGSPIQPPLRPPSRWVLGPEIRMMDGETGSRHRGGLDSSNGQIGHIHGASTGGVFSLAGVRVYVRV